MLWHFLPTVKADLRRAQQSPRLGTDAKERRSQGSQDVRGNIYSGLIPMSWGGGNGNSPKCPSPADQIHRKMVMDAHQGAPLIRRKGRTAGGGSQAPRPRAVRFHSGEICRDGKADSWLPGAGAPTETTEMVANPIMGTVARGLKTDAS